MLQQMDTGVVLNALSLLIIVASPLIRTSGISLYFVGNTYVRLALLGYIVYASYISVFSGILAFLAVFTLLLERNHGILTNFPKKNTDIPLEKYRIIEPPITNPSKVESEPDMDENYAEHITDNNPRLQPIAQGTSAASFYTSKNLA
jgi:hypothetical protein